MTQYVVQAPDGSRHIIEGPDNAAPPSPPPQQAPQSGGGDLAGSLYAGIHAYGNMAFLGQGDKVAALASSLTEQVGHMVGLDTAGITKAPESYSQNLQDIQSGGATNAAAHPIATTVGDVAGAIAPGVAGKVAQGVGVIGRSVPAVGRVLQAVEPAANAPISNLAKSAVTNGALGGGIALANGESVPQAAQTAGISAVLGPAVSKGASFALEKLAPAAQRAYMLLADKLQLKPQELETAIQNYQQVSGGAMPSVAGLANLKAQGRLAELAKANPTIGERAVTAANPGLQTPAQQGILKIAQGGGPQTASDLFDLRKSNMDRSMDQIRDTPVPFSQRSVNILSEPTVSQALRENARNLGSSSTLEKISNHIADGPSGSHLTLDDLDNIRESLRNRQDAYSNPNNAGHDRFVAREYGQAADKVEKLGTSVEPRYGAALNQYRSDSDYLSGFQHGTSGQAINDAKPGSQTAIALQRPNGQAGYAHGRQVAQSQGAVEAIAPSHVAPQSSGLGPQQAAQIGMAAASGGNVGAVYHFFKSLPVIGDRVPEPVQQKIASMLFDPGQTAAAVNVLRKAGVDAQTIRRAGALAGAGVSARVGAYLSKQGQ